MGAEEFAPQGLENSAQGFNPVLNVLTAFMVQGINENPDKPINNTVPKGPPRRGMKA